MLSVAKIDTTCRSHVRQFVDLPFRLYVGDPQWVPPIRSDIAGALNRNKHPFYEHSDAEFFTASRNGHIVGRVAFLENKPFNRHHGTRHADFYYFECEDDREAAAALFTAGAAWARSRGLDRIVGPKGLTPFDGYGILVSGFEHRQMMTMINHNLPYYGRFFDELGFSKEVDFVSSHVSIDAFRMPERISRIAARVQKRGTLRVRRFRNKRELLRAIPEIGQAYNNSFLHNWEYSPVTPKELDFVVEKLLAIADPHLIKVILHGDEMVGFLLAFPDVSAALQRMKGRVFPFGVLHVIRELRRADWLAINGAGILPRFQGCGGNALLYSEIEKTVRESGFRYAHLTQIAESAVQMRRDLEELGARPVKTHRVFALSL